MSVVKAVMSLTMEDNSKEVLEALHSVEKEMFKALGNQLQKDIQRFMIEDKIYDTGRLYNSISYCTPYADYSNLGMMNTPDDAIRGLRQENTVFYGSNVPYSA